MQIQQKCAPAPGGVVNRRSRHDDEAKKEFKTEQRSPQYMMAMLHDFTYEARSLLFILILFF